MTTPHGVIDAARLSIADVCRLVGASRSTVDRWCTHGLRGHRLRRIRIGGRAYVLRDDLDGWIAAMSDPPTTQQQEAEYARRAALAAAACGAIGL